MLTIPRAKLTKQRGDLDTEQLAQVEAIVLLWLGF
jgi:hypothetical protein